MDVDIEYISAYCINSMNIGFKLTMGCSSCLYRWALGHFKNTSHILTAAISRCLALASSAPSSGSQTAHWSRHPPYSPPIPPQAQKTVAVGDAPIPVLRVAFQESHAEAWGNLQFIAWPVQPRSELRPMGRIYFENEQCTGGSIFKWLFKWHISVNPVSWHVRIISVSSPGWYLWHTKMWYYYVR